MPSEAVPMNLFRFVPAALAHLEQINGGRLGVTVLDTGIGERSGHRQNERFPMCSTFKFLLVSAVLQRVNAHKETLDHVETPYEGSRLRDK